MTKKIERLTKEQACILTAYTGMGFTQPATVFFEYAQDKLGRVLMTHHFAEKEVWAELKKIVTEDFNKLYYEEND